MNQTTDRWDGATQGKTFHIGSKPYKKKLIGVGANTDWSIIETQTLTKQQESILSKSQSLKSDSVICICHATLRRECRVMKAFYSESIPFFYQTAAICCFSGRCQNLKCLQESRYLLYGWHNDNNSASSLKFIYCAAKTWKEHSFLFQIWLLWKEPEAKNNDNVDGETPIVREKTGEDSRFNRRVQSWHKRGLLRCCVAPVRVLKGPGDNIN